MLLHFDAKDRKDAESVIERWIRGGVIPARNYTVKEDSMRKCIGNMTAYIATA